MFICSIIVNNNRNKYKLKRMPNSNKETSPIHVVIKKRWNSMLHTMHAVLLLLPLLLLLLLLILRRSPSIAQVALKLLGSIILPYFFWVARATVVPDIYVSIFKKGSWTLYPGWINKQYVIKSGRLEQYYWYNHSLEIKCVNV